jgi:hypothetical protein
MTKIAFLLACLAGMAGAADVRYTWLPFSTNVPGIAETSTPATQYGISVLMDSDNPKVTEFQITVVVKRGNGAIVTVSGTATKQSKANDVVYSTIFSNLVDDSPDFQILAVQVKAVSSVNTTKPVPGLPYSSDDSKS